MATTAQAYWEFLDHNDLRARINARLGALDVADVTALAQAGAEIRAWVEAAALPPLLEAGLRSAYAALGENVSVAVRSSTEVWVVNHLSDSVSIVDVGATPPRVKCTLLVGDEPRDIVFAGTGGSRAFITTARRGQQLTHSTISSVVGGGDPKLTTPSEPRASGGSATRWASPITPAMLQKNVLGLPFAIVPAHSVWMRW